LLFLFLMRIGAGPIAGAVLCGLLSLHPLRAESVLWVAERKDVLSAAFWMWTLLAYLRYVDHPASGRRYALLLATYGAGLLTKPTLVSLPFILLLLDFWPLGRLNRAAYGAGLAGLLREKVPMIVLAAASGLAAVAGQHAENAL